MKRALFLLLIISVSQVFSKTDKYRLVLRNNPSNSIVIAWNQVSGNNAVVHFGTVDFGEDADKYPHSKSPDRIVMFRNMKNNFARLNGLQPDTVYYFVIKDSDGVSERYWFRTAPAGNERISLVSGGDSRNHRLARQNANKIVAKVRPNAVLFGGDMTLSDTDQQWSDWMDDWQLTITEDNQMIPVIATRGNHEKSDETIYNLFDTPSENNYYSISFGKNFLKVYTLNTEIAIPGEQTNWLRDDLRSTRRSIWKVVQYHKPMRPHVARKREGHFQYANWASLFEKYNVQLVVECDSHTVKTTWPLIPSIKEGSDEGFIRNDRRGTVYVGEGCWGAPLRADDDPKSWTRDSGSFNQVKWIFVSKNKMECRTVKTDNADAVSSLGKENRFDIPQGLNIWNPANGAVVNIKK